MAYAVSEPTIEGVNLSSIDDRTGKGHARPHVITGWIFRDQNAVAENVRREIAAAPEDVVGYRTSSRRRIRYTLWAGSVLLLQPAIVKAQDLPGRKVIVREGEVQSPLMLRWITWSRV